MKRQTGLLFGSFNPVHLGHLMLAQYVLDFGDVDDVWLVVSPQNPFKEQSGLAPAEIRVRMVRNAVAADSHISVCDVELTMPVPSYTIKTIERLEADYPDREFAIIMGGDNLPGLPHWREADRLLQGRRLIVYPRPGETTDASQVEAMGARVSVLNAPQVELSSTQIRRWVSEGKDVSHFVPREALEDVLRTYAGTSTRNDIK